MAPMFSIIIPVYNVEQYLAQCLDSVLAQTFTDFEVICINDGSKDSSLSILREYEKKDKRIKVIDRENGGVSAARNTGVEAAQGEYIAYLDSDDAYVAKLLKKINDEIEATKADIVVFGIKDMIDSAPDAWFDFVATTSSAYFSPFDPYALLYQPGAYPFMWRNVFRREMLVKNHVTFDERLKLGEDTVYQFMAFPYAHRIRYIPDKLYLYRRMRKNSATKEAHENLDKMIRTHVTIVNEIVQGWTERGLMEQYGDKLYPWILNFMIPDFKRISEDGKKKVAKELLAVMPEEYRPLTLNSYDEKLLNILQKYAGVKVKKVFGE